MVALVAHSCNASTWWLRQEDLKFKANLGYTDPVSKKKKKTTHTHTEKKSRLKTAIKNNIGLWPNLLDEAVLLLNEKQKGDMKPNQVF
jgi:hypothetical protein